MQVWFEVSQHTGRVHLHLQPDGTRPLGLSIPLERLSQQPHLPALSATQGDEALVPCVAAALGSE